MMQVKIKNYRVILGENRVEVDIEVDLPTGQVNVTINVVESALITMANASNKTSWDEEELVNIVSNFFSQLSNSVVY